MIFRLEKLELRQAGGRAQPIPTQDSAQFLRDVAAELARYAEVRLGIVGA